MGDQPDGDRGPNQAAPTEAEDTPDAAARTIGGQSRAAMSEDARLSEKLDHDHAVETNGRMAVCRRCGFRTVAPESDRHLVSERYRARAREWLEASARTRRADYKRNARDT